MVSRVKDIMTPDPVTVTVPGTRTEAVRRMIKYNITGMPVVDESGKAVGMLSRRDIFENPSVEQLALLMRTNVPMLPSNTSVEDGAKIMLESGRRHLIVVDDKQSPIGILTPQDFLKVVVERRIITPVEEYMSTPCFPVYEETPIKVIFQAMRLAHLNAFPVVDSYGKLKGIVSDRDIFEASYIDKGTAVSELGLGDDEDIWNWDGIKNVMKLVYVVSNLELPEAPVKNVMVKDEDIEYVLSKTPAHEAAKIMLDNNFSQLPLRDIHDELQAMLYEFDLVKAIL